MNAPAPDPQLQATGTDVFISYARENREVAAQLAAALTAHALRVWWDREIPAGAEFADVIEIQLHGARVVIALWSADSIRSSFVRDESARALQAGKLLPVRIEDVQLPLGFGQIHTLDLLDWDGDAEDEGFVQLLAEIRRLQGQPAATSDPRRHVPRKWRRYLAAALIAAAIGALGYAGFAARENSLAEDAFRLGLERQFAKEPNLQSARNLYLSALEHRPDHARARYYLAHVYAQLGQTTDASRAFDLALKHEDSLDEGQRADAHKQLVALSAVSEPAPIARAAASTEPAPAAAAPGPAPPPPPGAEPKPSGATTPAEPPISKQPPRLEPPPARVAQLSAQIEGLFDENKETRITATTSLVVDPEALSDAAPLAIAKALAVLRGSGSALSESSASGVVNTLVLLQSVLPGTLQAQRGAVEELLSAARPVGDYTKQQADKVAASLKLAAAQRPVVYIQIASEAQRAIADTLVQRFRSFGYEVPGVEVVGNRAPERTQVRVQGKSERGYARWIARGLAQIAGAPSVISTLRNARPKTDTYEIWLDRDLCAPSGKMVEGCKG